jgi:hypothetical protein
MTADELRIALSQLLALEEGESVNWDEIQDTSITILNRLRVEEEALAYPSELVIPYLTEFKLRQASDEEAHRQRGLLIAYLRLPPD